MNFMRILHKKETKGRLRGDRYAYTTTKSGQLSLTLLGPRESIYRTNLHFNRNPDHFDARTYKEPD